MERRNVSFEQVKAKIEAKRNTEPMINPTHPNQYITEEQWIEDHFDEFVPCKNQEEMRKELMKAAEEKLNETEKPNKKMFTLRLDQGDLAKLKVLAEEQGLQYQSLLGSIIHRYVNGTLIDITEAKKILVFQKA